RVFFMRSVCSAVISSREAYSMLVCGPLRVEMMSVGEATGVFLSCGRDRLGNRDRGLAVLCKPFTNRPIGQEVCDRGYNALPLCARLSPRKNGAVPDGAAPTTPSSHIYARQRGCRQSAAPHPRFHDP